MACESEKCEKYGLHHEYDKGIEIRKCFACEKDNQPERSKREDFVCNHKCKWLHISWAWKDGCTDPDTRGECKTKMRCSEHCGNTMRDK